jgi:hypothetical protein
MTVRLFQLPSHPGRVAISKVDSFVVGGTFFLDFSRPLEKIKWRDLWFGRTLALIVPVIHETEGDGGYVVGVHRSEPAFGDVCALWKTNYPLRAAPPPSQKPEGLRIIADFATQCPADARVPSQGP